MKKYQEFTEEQIVELFEEKLPVSANVVFLKTAENRKEGEPQKIYIFEIEQTHSLEVFANSLLNMCRNIAKKFNHLYGDKLSVELVSCKKRHVAIEFTSPSGFKSIVNFYDPILQFEVQDILDSYKKLNLW